MGKEWFPSLEEYNPGITKEQWIEFVQDKNLFNENALEVFDETGILEGIEVLERKNISCIMANIAWNKNNWKFPSDNKTNFRWTQKKGNIPGESWNFDFDNPRNTEKEILGFTQFKNPPKTAEKDKFLIIFRSSNNIIGFYGNAEIKKEPVKINENESVNLFGDKRLSLLLENKIDDTNHEFLFGKERISQGGFNKIDNKDAIRIIDESIKLNPNQIDTLKKIKEWLKQGDTKMEKQYWLIAPGENARKWDEYSKNDEIGIGWEELGNIEKYDSDYDSFQNDYIKTYKSENDNYRGSSPKQIWNFYKTIAIGDIIFARNGVRQIIGMGKVISNYIYDDSREEYKHIRKVKWEKIGEWNYPGQSSRDTVHNLKPEQAEEILIIMSNKMTGYEEKLDEIKNNLLVNRNVILTGAPGTGKTFMAKTVAERMGCTENEIRFVQFHPSYDYTDFVEGLRPIKNDNSDQIGFERKDGVFKKFCEKALKNLVDSRKSVEEVAEEKDIARKIEYYLDDSIKNKKEFLLKNGNKFNIVDYDDKWIFVEIPNNSSPDLKVSKFDIINIFEKNIQLNEVKDVRLIHSAQTRQQQDSYVFVICKEIDKLKISSPKNTSETAEKIPLKNFVFIIDEINRGEIAKIFGELFYSVDPGYRVTSDDLDAIKNGNKTVTTIKTQYANLETKGNEFDKALCATDYGHFFIPENVYIIGTMNDIDRSVESMDFAFRRRFSWIEVKASDTVDMLDPKHDDNGELISGLETDLADEAKRRMKNLNAEISKIEDLNDAYHIGASYFLKLKNYGGDFGKLWDYHIKGILQEYLRGNPNGKLEDLKAAYDKKEELKAGE